MRDAEARLHAIDRRIVDAYGEGLATLDALVGDDFLFTAIDGSWLSREAFLAQSPMSFTEVARDEVQAGIFGDAAVLHGHFHGRARAGDHAHVRYTHAYARHGDRWRLVNAQHTPIDPAAGTGDGTPDAPIIAAPWRGTDPQGEDTAVITTLNARYVQAFRDADVSWYDAHLAPEYRVVFGDGSIHGRAAALADFAVPHFAERMSEFPLDKVRVRRFGDAALIHAENAYTLKDRRKGVNRYTDIWIKRGGRWWCVAAHITVHAPPH